MSCKALAKGNHWRPWWSGKAMLRIAVSLLLLVVMLNVRMQAQSATSEVTGTAVQGTEVTGTEATGHEVPGEAPGSVAATAPTPTAETGTATSPSTTPGDTTPANTTPDAATTSGDAVPAASAVPAPAPAQASSAETPQAASEAAATGAAQQSTPPAPQPTSSPVSATVPPSASPSASQPVPGAMATKSKTNASDYDEVHVKPLVKSEEKAKFNPSSPAAVEAEVDPSLKTHTKPIRVDVDLVLVPVTITDQANRLVTGLGVDNFVLMDNGERQKIQHFSCEDAPISLGVIFDMSGSMSNKIDKAREAIMEFFKTSNPEDEFFLIAFNEKPMLVADFTSDVEQIESNLVYTLPKGRTALLDSIYMGVAKMRQAKYQRKALLIISDGGDNRSRYTENEIKSMVREADVQIYAIGIFDQMARTDEERFGPELLADVTEVTGGRTYAVNNPNQLANVATKIGVELRNQYVLGYRPAKPARNGRWRKVKVKLNIPKGLPQLSVYAKTGYYAPSE